MKVFLKKSVAGVGKAQQVIDVADGYARNYLLPRGLAVPASAGNVNVAKQVAEMHERQEARIREHAQRIAAELSEKTLTFTMKAGETGRLYGSVTSSDIAEQLTATLREEFDKRWVQLERPLRDLGEHVVDLRLEGGVRAQVKVVVEPEE